MPAGLSSTGPIHRLHVQDLIPNRHISKLLFHAFVISLPINLCHTNFIKEGGDAVLRKHTSLLEHVLPVHLKHCEEKSKWHVRKDFIIRLPEKPSKFAFFWLSRDKLLLVLSQDVLLSKFVTLFAKKDRIISLLCKQMEEVFRIYWNSAFNIF